MGVSICPPAGGFCPQSELEAVQGHAQEGNAGGKRRRETQEGCAGGGRRREAQKGNAGGKRRRDAQEGSAGGKRRRGPPEWSAGGWRRRKTQERNAGGECHSGAQEGNAGGERRRGAQEGNARVERRRGISGVAHFSAGGCCCWEPPHVLESLQGGAPEGYIGCRPRGVAVGGHRMPWGASWVGVTTLIPETPFPILLRK